MILIIKPWFFQKYSMSGYIYCFSHDNMEGVYKIGFTKRSPLMRLKEANRGNTWALSGKFHIEFSKKVNDCRKMEKNIHDILDSFDTRIQPNREFFKLSLSTIKKIFEITKGDWYIDNDNIDDNDEDTNKSIIYPSIEDVSVNACEELEINNFGNENTSYISKIDFLKLFESGYKIIPKFIEMIHFNKCFPQNHNVYTRGCKNEYVLIFSDNKWKSFRKVNIIRRLIFKSCRLLKTEFDLFNEGELKDIMDVESKRLLQQYLSAIHDEEIALLNTNNMYYSGMLDDLQEAIDPLLYKGKSILTEYKIKVDSSKCIGLNDTEREL